MRLPCVLDKFYATSMDLVQWQWSGCHGRVVKGISLTTLMWTDGDRHVPCDYRIYEKQADGKTKNDHCRDMLTAAAHRGFEPRCVAFDSWFSSLANLKHIRDLGGGGHYKVYKVKWGDFFPNIAK